MTFRQFIDSVWFRGISRTAMILTPLMLAGFGLVWWLVSTDATKQVVELRSVVSDVKVTQTARANDSETFQTEVRQAVADIGKKVDDVSDDLFATKVDVGVIKRLVTELRNESVAAAALDPRALAAPSQVR